MTLRTRIHAALPEIELVSKRTDRDFERYAGIDRTGDMRRAHDLHMDGLREAWRILSEIGNAPEAHDALMKLQAKDPAAFEAIMVLVRMELERPAPAEQARAA